MNDRPFKNVMDALGQAIEITSDCKYRRISTQIRLGLPNESILIVLRGERIFQSMSRKETVSDNSSYGELLWIKLKQDLLYVAYYSYDELKSEIERYIKGHNEQRIKRKTRC